jgi:hypothetical protein
VGAARAVVARRIDRRDRAIMVNVNWEKDELELGIIKEKVRCLKLGMLCIADFIGFYLN